MTRVLSALIVLTGLTAAFVVSYPAIRCDRVKETTQRRTLALLGKPNEARGARRNLASLEWCARYCRGDADIYVILAANYRILQRNEEAIALYQLALRYERRPEIYYNLGLCLLEEGKHDQAMEALIVAAMFDPYVIWRLPASIAKDVADVVRKHDPAI